MESLEIDPFIHPSAFIEDNCEIGLGSKIWHGCQVRTGAKIGKNCILGKGVFIDTNVEIGDNVKIQNYVSVYQGVYVDSDVFIGPHVVFTNDLNPRAKGNWKISKTFVKRGVSIGANSTIRCGIALNEYCLIGAGSVVTKTIPAHWLVYGNPARFKGYVCICGEKATVSNSDQNIITCSSCGSRISLPTPEKD